MLCADPEGWDGSDEGVQEGTEIRIHTADSLVCTADMNATM